MPAIRIIPIKAKPIADMRKMKSAIQKALDDEGKELVKWFNYTIQEWNNEKPTFRYTTGGTPHRVWVYCFPDGDAVGVEKWTRLDLGTDPHEITPVRAKYLSFPWQGPKISYKAITTVGQLISHPGGQKLGPMRKFSAVNHPGTEARQWSEVLADQEIYPFAARVEAAIDGALNS